MLSPQGLHIPVLRTISTIKLSSTPFYQPGICSTNMACLCCLEKCLPLEEENIKEDPLVDLEKAILKVAWDCLLADPPEQLSWRERLCPLRKVLRLEVDKSFLGFEPKEMKLFPQNADLPATTAGQTTVLFKSHYRNDTDSVQHYSFKTERTTKSSVELSLQRGFTVGQTLEVDLKIPSGVPGCDVSGKLGGQLQWSFQRGKITRQEDQVMWSVDNQVAVAPGTTGEARLKVRECRWKADFKLPCTIRPRTDDHKIPVFVRRRRSGDLVKVFDVSCYDVVAECGDHIRLDEHDDGAITCDLQGVCHVVCAVEQEVWLREATLLPPEAAIEPPVVIPVDGLVKDKGS